ncbi:ABC transporter ATP-binding protein [Microvirga sp. BSC39]|uniref:ABC transporter ATP-binding protein n=1 Tax=Microvirga sp. BSC39 TaxID=1549810 RepID=UPI0004E94A9F|nr:ABC transporter ATP-binding protein [Microvirga sp. BSC39]KFG68654.1 putrescine/spermidine ABC transporter ATPase [Microvirga sp. BSC39]
MNAFLEVSDAHVFYGQNEVLKGVDLAVDKGEFVALLGSSGCGKTTLLRSIAGFNTPASGAIRVDGRDVTRLPPDKRGMALVFQSYALWPHMTVDQNIGYGLKLRGMAKAAIGERVSEIKRLLGLEPLGARKPANLSGGQRQRVALGRALAIQPDILLLDEPLSNLDARIRLTVRHEISALQRRLGITAVHVTHDREEAMVMADRIVILDNGKIAQVGTPEEVYNHPTSDFVAAFMGAENLLDLSGGTSGDRIEIASGPFNSSAVVSARGRKLSGPLNARFRGESVQLSEETADVSSMRDECFLTLSGIVEQTSYPGGLWRHVIALGEAHAIVDSPRSFAIGQRVSIRVPEEALFLFPKP